MGDCYFLVALLLVAKVPTRISGILPNPDFTDSGAALVNARVLGVPTQIVVDNDFAFYNSQNTDLYFGKTQTDEAWVQIIEKAWAKTNGNYNRIKSGLAVEALEWLEGYPGFFYSLSPTPAEEVKDVDAVWKFLSENSN